MTLNSDAQFSERERGAVYRAIFERRDVRSGFLTTPIPQEVLQRILIAAHHAPSVGFMQPWDFIAISSPEIRQEVKAIFVEANNAAAENYRGDRQNLYRSLKLEGIMESPLNLCITCNRTRGGPHVLGRNTIVDTDIFSVCLAVQNLWLAARAEGIGVGWVSIVDPDKLGKLLELPQSVYPVAYLCMGYVREFKRQPDLEVAGWRSRLDVSELLHHNKWVQAQTEESKSSEQVVESAAGSTKKSSPQSEKKKKPALMLQGTASSVGKTLLAAAFCRIFVQDGYKVAPFKAQNMSNNSWVTVNGDEIARSQVNQAQAARVEPDHRMNPILLKPLSNMKSQIIVCGKAVGTYDFRAYGKSHDEYFARVCECYDSLADEFDLLVLEGAGCSAEVNLKDRDLVNMKMGRHADARVIIVGDIDRGGVFASFIGMMTTFNGWERHLVLGYLINRFRGDKSLLDNAHDYMKEKTGKPVLGVIPLIRDLKIPEEDGVQFSENAFHDETPLGDRIDVAVLQLGFVSNFTDVDPLRFEADVRVRLVRSRDELGIPDVLIILGSRNVFAEMALLKQRDLRDAIVELAQKGTEIVGLCGGLQMLGSLIRDPHGVESRNESIPGLGLLSLTTELRAHKTLVRESGRHLVSALPVKGYRIHHGVTVESLSTPVVVGDDGSAIGYQSENSLTWGTYLHGIFDDDTFRRWFINNVRERKGSPRLEVSPFVYSLDAEFDRLADEVRNSVDMNHIYHSLGI